VKIAAVFGPVVVAAAVIAPPGPPAEAPFRVFPGAAGEGAAPGALRLSAARNEFECFRLLPAAPVELGVRCSPFFGGDGSVSPLALSCYSMGQGGRLDPLPGAREGGRRVYRTAVRGPGEGLLFEIFVPPGTAPGTYRAVLAASAGGRCRRFSCRVRVWDFSLESTPPFPVFFPLPGGPSAFAGLRDEGEKELQSLLDAVLAHRLTVADFTAAAPDFHGSPVDWEEFERRWGPYLYGRDYPGGLRRARLTAAVFPRAADRRLRREMTEEFRDRGWPDPVDYPPADGESSLPGASVSVFSSYGLWGRYAEEGMVRLERGDCRGAVVAAGGGFRVGAVLKDLRDRVEEMQYLERLRRTRGPRPAAAVVAAARTARWRPGVCRELRFRVGRLLSAPGRSAAWVRRNGEEA